MARNRTSRSLLDTVGEELIRIITPVSICMLLVVLLVSALDSNTDNSSTVSATISDIIYSDYDNGPSSSFWDKFEGALLESLALVAAVTVATFVMVGLFYFRCTGCLKVYMGYSAFLVLGVLGGQAGLFFIEKFRVPVDSVTFCVVLFNFAVVGVLAVFMPKMPILVTQAYLVVIAVLVAYWFTMLPEWTTWVLLVAMALYDLAAVLLPVGPLRLLVDLAISRDEDIPAFVYEARPVIHHDSGLRSDGVQRRVWRDRGINNSNSNTNVQSSGNVLNLPSNSNLGTDSLSNSDMHPGSSSGSHSDTGLARAEEGRVMEIDAELSVPLIDSRMNRQPHQQGNILSSESSILEGVGLGSSGAIKLGLGDFIFYSVLVGRAAMYDYMTVYACYLAIIAGLGVTLMLLAFYQKALPALPVSILLGVSFYFLTRLLLEPFTVQCSINLLMF